MTGQAWITRLSQRSGILQVSKGRKQCNQDSWARNGPVKSEAMPSSGSSPGISHLLLFALSPNSPTSFEDQHFPTSQYVHGSSWLLQPPNTT